MTRKTKVVIIQGYNTPYRNELFNLISDYDDIDLTLLYISQKGLNKKWKDDLQTRFNEVQVKCKVRLASYEDRQTRLNYPDFIKKITALNPDVIISGLNKYTILSNYILFWKKVRLVHWSEATMVTERGINWYKRPYLRRHMGVPAAFLFPGKMAKEYHEFCGFDVNNRIFWAPNSVDDLYTVSEQQLENKYADIRPLKFLFIGSFVERKGFHTLKEAFKRLKASGYNFELHIAGDGPIRPSEEMINHGFLKKDETSLLYKDCHVFIMPSQWDCNPLSLIEAAKGGNVLLASRGVGNYPELINGNGYVFNVDDEDDLFIQCEKLLSAGQDELMKMGRKSIELASSISHRNTAEAFHDAIKFVMTEK
jgi:glycosyltransferase involved in cell wall biosynthesis